MSTNLLHHPASFNHVDRVALEQEIGERIPTAFILLEALDRRTLASCRPALTTAQFHTLAALDRVPEQNLGQLAGRLLCDKANASKIIDKLEALALATRSQDPADRRRVTLRLTDDGKAVLERARALRAVALQRVFSALHDEELNGVTRDLVTLVSLLRQSV